MPKFTKNAVTIEAEQFLGDDFSLPFSREGACAYDADIDLYYVITTHGNKAYLEKGDWVIREMDENGFYPCKDEIFIKTYQHEIASMRVVKILGDGSPENTRILIDGTDITRFIAKMVLTIAARQTAKLVLEIHPHIVELPEELFVEMEVKNVT
jgi:hypothetical protein